MKRVFSSHSEVAHVWAQQSQSEGRSSDGRMFFEGDKIYSYGRHFCIARILPSGVVVFGTHRYSPSTAKHQSHARSAVNHRREVYCQDHDNTVRQESEYARNRIAECLNDAANKPRIREATRVGLRASALNLANQFNVYLAAMPDDEKEGVEPIDTSNLADVMQELMQQKEREAEAARKRAAERAVKQRENLAEWRAGSGHHYGFYDLPAALRLHGDEVQTSHGAVISVDDAKQLWPFIQRVMRGDKDYEVGMQLGYYRLTKIRRDGSIVVGCHDIAYSEIENIAKALGLIEVAKA